MTRKRCLIGSSVFILVLLSAFVLFFRQQEPNSDVESGLLERTSEEQNLYSPEEWKAYRKIWDYIQAQKRARQDPNATPIPFPKDLNVEHLNFELFMSEGLREYRENSPGWRERQETIKMLEKQMPEYRALYEEAKRFNENLPQVKLEDEREWQRREEILKERLARLSRLDELYARVLELRKIVEERQHQTRMPSNTPSEPVTEAATEAAAPSPENTGATDEWRLISPPMQERVQEWHDALYQDYFDVILIKELTQEEINTAFPTPESQRYLQTQVSHLQTELASRAERLLSEETGNRAEKLSIIRETLSENWGTDVADGVLEQLTAD